LQAIDYVAQHLHKALVLKGFVHFLGNADNPRTPLTAPPLHRFVHRLASPPEVASSK